MEPVRKNHHIAADPRLVYDTVVDYESYPNFFPEFMGATILDKDGAEWVVEFVADFGKKTEYTLSIQHFEDELRTKWTYVGGDLKNSEGGWHMKDDGKGGCDIDYHIAVEVGFFVPRMISDRLVSKGIPTMFSKLTEEVERRKARS